MGRDESALDRRTLLAGAVGTVGVVITGCSAPPGLNGPNAEPARSSTPGLLPSTANPSPVITSAQPRSHPSAATEPASSREIIKRATVPVLCYHQLRNWQSGDSQYNRLNLICPPNTFGLTLTRWPRTAGPRSVPPTTTSRPAQHYRVPVMLSFDDGSAGQAHEGLAQLAKRGMTAPLRDDSRTGCPGG